MLLGAIVGKKSITIGGKKSAVLLFICFIAYYVVVLLSQCNLNINKLQIISLLPLLVGMIVDIRFLVYFFMGQGNGHVQSLVLGSTSIMVGVLIFVIGLLADLIAKNRKLLEDVQYRVRRLDYKNDIENSNNK